MQQFFKSPGWSIRCRAAFVGVPPAASGQTFAVAFRARAFDRDDASASCEPTPAASDACSTPETFHNVNVL